MRTGLRQQVQVKTKKFNIIDLSFLVRILNGSTINDMLTTDIFIGDILFTKGNLVLNLPHTNNRNLDSQTNIKIIEFVTKIKTVCNILNR